MAKRRAEPVDVAVRDLSHDGRGVASNDGKVFFVHGALPGETVRARREKKRRDLDEGVATEILESSEDRITPRCEVFGLCGGCALQHLEPSRQLAMKQSQVAENLERLGKVRPEEWLEPVTGPLWGYRRRARLGVKDVRAKGRVLVGFRERGKPYVTDMERCHVLIPRVGASLGALSDLLGEMDARASIPQIEVAAGDEMIVLVFRHLRPLGEADRERLRQFGAEHDFWIHLQSGGPETIEPLSADAPALCYRIPEFDVELCFRPTDFIQINSEVNRSLVLRALEELDPGDGEPVLDLFSGLGNFSLPLARQGARVTAVEGEAGLVQRGRDNAAANGLEGIEFHSADLSGDIAGQPWARGSYAKALLDPPRSGARELIPQLPRMGVERVVYVSCHPATLARDAGQLVHECGYRMTRAGVLDMFPQTAHVESMAVFERNG